MRDAGDADARYTPACRACFLIFDDHVEVLAVIDPKERIDSSMTPEAARDRNGMLLSVSG